MPSNWHVRREEPTIAELKENVAELQSEATEALQEGGEHSRRHRQATQNLAVAERRLSSAKAKEEQRRKESELSPSEIVDRIMRG